VRTWLVYMYTQRRKMRRSARLQRGGYFLLFWSYFYLRGIPMVDHAVRSTIMTIMFRQHVCHVADGPNPTRRTVTDISFFSFLDRLPLRCWWMDACLLVLSCVSLSRTITLPTHRHHTHRTRSPIKLWLWSWLESTARKMRTKRRL